MDAAKTVIPDLDALWMPFTANRQYKAAPRLLASASGMYYTTHDGRKILDGCAGLWCVAAGHCRKEIADAIAHQVQTLDYAPPFQMGHPLSFEAASKVAAIMPSGLDRIFFTNSGSESVDTALKIALSYHRARGEGQRTRFIGRERGYHGVGFGGMAVGGIGPNRKAFSANLMPGTDHLPATLNIAEAAFSKGQPTWGAHLADDLERIIALHDPSNVAAVIVEPLAGSAGVLVPPVGYLERLREITSKHGILLIFDEVITAFGRLGAATAAERFQVTPDLITMAKAINNAAVPMGAVAVRREVHDTVIDAAAAGAIELPHGYTYSGHPLAAAAAIVTLDLYRSDDLFGRAAKLAPLFEEAAHGVRGAPHVKDIRNLGLVAGIELEPRPGQPGARGYEVFLKCLERGVLVRYTGDILAFSPPLIVTEAQIAELFDTVRQVLKDVQ
ncbi:aspartate aminotransferase family protein [Cupriavidus sp. JZ107]